MGQPGSVFIGDRKVKVDHPRLRGPAGEMRLRSYEKLRDSGGFSEELLGKVLRGLAQRRYSQTLVEAGKAFGVSAGSIFRHVVKASARRLKEFRERSLKGFEPFALFLGHNSSRGVRPFWWDWGLMWRERSGC